MGKEKDKLDMLREAKSSGAQRPSLSEYGLLYPGGAIDEVTVTGIIPGIKDEWGSTWQPGTSQILAQRGIKHANDLLQTQGRDAALEYINSLPDDYANYIYERSLGPNADFANDVVGRKDFQWLNNFMFGATGGVPGVVISGINAAKNAAIKNMSNGKYHTAGQAISGGLGLDYNNMPWYGKVGVELLGSPEMWLRPSTVNSGVKSMGNGIQVVAQNTKNLVGRLMTNSDVIPTYSTSGAFSMNIPVVKFKKIGKMPISKVEATVQPSDGGIAYNVFSNGTQIGTRVNYPLKSDGWFSRNKIERSIDRSMGEGSTAVEYKYSYPKEGGYVKEFEIGGKKYAKTYDKKGDLIKTEEISGDTRTALTGDAVPKDVFEIPSKISSNTTTHTVHGDGSFWGGLKSGFKKESNTDFGKWLQRQSNKLGYGLGWSIRNSWKPLALYGLGYEVPAVLHRTFGTTSAEEAFDNNWSNAEDSQKQIMYNEGPGYLSILNQLIDEVAPYADKYSTEVINSKTGAVKVNKNDTKPSSKKDQTVLAGDDI